MHASVKIATVGLAAALSLTGCSLAADITTARSYDASDGSGVAASGVVIQNMLLVTTDADAPGALIGAVYNSRSEDVTITVSVSDAEVEVDVPAMETVVFGPGDDEELVLTGSSNGPGFLTEATFQIEGVGSETLPVPIVDGTLPEYAPVLALVAALD